MINPVPSSQGPSSEVQLQEAVLQFGATQAMREQQRVERTAANDNEAAPLDQADIDMSDDCAADPDGTPATAPATSQGEARHGRNDEAERVGVRTQRSAGERQHQHETAVAKYASEQQGKRELRRQDLERTQRSTRQQIGHVRSIGPTSQTAVTSEDTAPASPRTAADESAPEAERTASGENETVGQGLMRVHARFHEDEETVHGHSRDVSTDPGTRGKRDRRQHSFDQETGSHGGDGGREHSRHQPYNSARPRGKPDAGKEPTDDAPHPYASSVPEQLGVAANADVTTDAPSGDAPSSVPVASTDTPACGSASAHVPSTEQEPHHSISVPETDTPERHVLHSPGVEALESEEYFFFDDAPVDPDPSTEETDPPPTA